MGTNTVKTFSPLRLGHLSHCHLCHLVEKVRCDEPEVPILVVTLADSITRTSYLASWTQDLLILKVAALLTTNINELMSASSTVPGSQRFLNSWFIEAC